MAPACKRRDEEGLWTDLGKAKLDLFGETNLKELWIFSSAYIFSAQFASKFPVVFLYIFLHFCIRVMIPSRIYVIIFEFFFLSFFLSFCRNWVELRLIEKRFSNNRELLSVLWELIMKFYYISPFHFFPTFYQWNYKCIANKVSLIIRKSRKSYDN